MQVGSNEDITAPKVWFNSLQTAEGTRINLDHKVQLQSRMKLDFLLTRQQSWELHQDCVQEESWSIQSQS